MLLLLLFHILWFPFCLVLFSFFIIIIPGNIVMIIIIILVDNENISFDARLVT
jgi:hypothetical protein